MMKKEIPGGDTNSWARVCDTCRSAPCTVYCRADSAYLCTSCDARIHAANQLASRHERVWVCEACERAPAAFLCKADAASLCATCDADIHSANPLARRHHRVPIMPVGCVYGPSDGKMSEDGFLDLDLFEYNSGADNQFCEQYNQQQEFSVPEKNCGGDSVVPVQCREGKDHLIQYQNFLFGMECETKHIPLRKNFILIWPSIIDPLCRLRNLYSLSTKNIPKPILYYWTSTHISDGLMGNSHHKIGLTNSLGLGESFRFHELFD